MASTPSSTQTDPRSDGDVAPTVAADPFTGVEEALTRLAHQPATDTPDARPRGPAFGTRAGVRPAPSFAAATLGPAELGPAELSTQIPREPRSLGKRRALARAAIAVCLGACALWAWGSYGGRARDMIATWAPPVGWISAGPAANPPPARQTPEPASLQATAPGAVETSVPPPAQAALQTVPTAANAPAPTSAEHPQIETMARDLAALRQTVEQLVAGQEQLTREIAKLQAEKAQADKPAAMKPDKRKLPRVSAPGRHPDAFDPAQNPGAPGVPRSLGSIVLRPRSPRRRAGPARQRRSGRKALRSSRR